MTTLQNTIHRLQERMVRCPDGSDRMDLFFAIRMLKRALWNLSASAPSNASKETTT